MSNPAIGTLSILGFYHLGVSLASIIGFANNLGCHGIDSIWLVIWSIISLTWIIMQIGISDTKDMGLMGFLIGLFSVIVLTGLWSLGVTILIDYPNNCGYNYISVLIYIGLVIHWPTVVLTWYINHSNWRPIRYQI